MVQHTIFKRRYTCGQHVKGHGRSILVRGKSVSSGKVQLIEKGVITILPGKSVEPYTVLDEKTFVLLEAQEEDLNPLS